jgi:hypothetical protein
MECPRCRLINPESAERCDCGYSFRPSAERPSTPSPRRIDLTADPPLDQAGLAHLLRQRFPDCLIGDHAQGRGVILGSPLRKCRWALHVRRRLLRGVCVSHFQDITYFARPKGPPYLEVVSDSACQGLPLGPFSLFRLVVGAGEGEDLALLHELRYYLSNDLPGTVRRVVGHEPGVP